ncbi:MAG: purine-nucleoside phosphorylase [Myxococcota bacterium]
MDIVSRVQQTVDFIRSRCVVHPEVAVVLGSGLGVFADRVSNTTIFPYADLPGFPRSSVTGHRGELVLGDLEGVPCAVMSGRVHYYEGYSMAEVTFPMRVLAGLGCAKVVITNAAGGVDAQFLPGDLMVIVDQLNLTGDNPLRGPNDERLGPRFPDMTDVYCVAGRQALHAAAAEMGTVLREGVYAGFAGPSYETPAEVRMARLLGASAVGMSTVSEAIVARHGGMRVAGLSVISNLAAGLGEHPLSHDEVKEVAGRVENALCELLSRAVVKFART